MSTKLPVTVIIPTFNGHRLLEKHLPAVMIALRPGDELLIIDDAGEDETTTWLRHGFSLTANAKPSFSDGKGDFALFQGLYGKGNKRCSITVVKNEKNLRFAAAVNRAVRLAHNPLLFLLNNDVSPEPDTISILASHFESATAQPTLFGVAPLEYEGSSTSAPTAGKNNVFFQKGIFMHSRADEMTAGETAWVSGGSGLFDKLKFLELEGFDEQFYPAYWEDVDISFRARKRGWTVQFDPTARVFHQHESTNAQVFSTKEIESVSWRHARYFVFKHGSWWQKVQFVLWKPYWWYQRRKKL